MEKENLRFFGLLSTGPNILPNHLAVVKPSSWIQKEIVNLLNVVRAPKHL